jgi:hypothetical protein
MWWGRSFNPSRRKTILALRRRAGTTKQRRSLDRRCSISASMFDQAAAEAEPAIGTSEIVFRTWDAIW